jgi:head-tail adaptor
MGVALNRRLELEAPVPSPDGAGGRRETWVTLGVVWGRVAPRSGRMAEGAAGAVSRRRFRITLRAAPEGHGARPRPGQRLRMGARLFRIEAVTEQEPEALYLLCDCEEEVLP